MLQTLWNDRLDLMDYQEMSADSSESHFCDQLIEEIEDKIVEVMQNG